nr:cadherin-like protein 26 isoform X1 [Misgurnus anguillicaudatus]
MFTYFLLLGMICTCSTHLHGRHKRSWIIDSFDIVEEHPGPYPFELGQIKLDRSYSVEFLLKGKGVDEEPKGVLSINPTTGLIKVHRKVDYEQFRVLKLTFQARNKSNYAIDTQLGMEVNILDINDNAPVFQTKLYNVTITEATKQGGFILGVLATDRDAPGTINSTVDYKIISVTPKTPNAEFYMRDNAIISFRGCLDYEVANKYTILVEAKDRGEIVKMSSTTTVVINIQDGNNHMPVITGQTGSSKVLEGTNGSSPLIIHTTDLDTRLTAAWRAVYTIQGDKYDHFSIHTDPDTNDGVLTVVKPLDYEKQALQSISITVDNDEPFYSCEVKDRPASGLWIITSHQATKSTRGFNITVEDVNEPPYFPQRVRRVVLEENGAVGVFVDKVVAVDPDTQQKPVLQYTLEQDPAGWLRVNATTGEIFVKKPLDRESSYVKNGTYTVTVIVTEKDDPKMTSTATVNIYVEDKNDNVPMLKETAVSVCQSDEVSSTEITAYDLDGDPYSGPFRFELIGDVKDEWSIDPSHGNTVHLVKHKNVYPGMYTLTVKISDKQGISFLQNLTVSACDCSVSPSCLVQRNTQKKVGTGVIGTAIFASLLVFALLLLSITCSCGAVKSLAHVDYVLNNVLPSNTENPGTDCMVPNTLLKKKYEAQSKEATLVSNNIQTKVNVQQVASMNMSPRNTLIQMNGIQTSKRAQYNFNEQISTWKQSLYRSNSHYKGTMVSRMTSKRQNSYTMSRLHLQNILVQRLHSIQSLGNELLDYEPHRYAFEDNSEYFSDLDPIDLPDNDFDPEPFSDLGPAFRQLASICNPEKSSTTKVIENGTIKYM